ncbi:MAG: LD-carboxypeptidase [Deltaproteobacteria bacterium]|nr:LD-carboxypeptidase [Desulfitobacteriaceae bacterium]MDI6854792.1 LD-carboxypeptidase [Deltaproteobacteria bacterium]
MKDPNQSSSPEFFWPPPVKPGDLIAVAAPASPVDCNLCQAGVRILEDAGLRVLCGPDVFAARAWGREADRGLARRFQEIWLNPDIKAVIGARGGYGSLKLLPHLEVTSLQEHPKRLIGFSDLTNLLLHFHYRLRFVTFHGPTVAQLPSLTPGARQSFFHWLTAAGPQTFSYQGLTVLHQGAAQGHLAGGNLTTLCHLLGTPYAPRFNGTLLFLEDHNEAVYRLDRLMHHLLFSGVLEGVKGIILGSFTGSNDQDSLLEVMQTALKPLNVPVLAGLPVGHHPDNYTLPLGAAALLDSQTASLTFL